ncbi:MAG: ABC transporter substrate-binding protein [Gammaproteobacteria bacterium]|nr:ABC transporter substrate-binding protein [Gammaproteobacteria bacterium]
MLGSVLISAAAADFSTPRGRVQDSVDRVLEILRDPALDRDGRWLKVAAVIRAGFDFRSMSQSVLATQWKKATPEEREQFTRYFSQYIEDVYREKIEAYAGQEVVYGKEVVEGDLAAVDMDIRTTTTSIPVTFRLRSNNGNWFCYDVIIEGVSLVANYRGTFAAISRNEGMDAIMTDIQQRVARYRERHGQAPDGGPGAAPESH